MHISFQGKRIIVCGGSRGIGRSIALAFAAEGADVAICGRERERVKDTEAELKEKGGKVFGMACDLSDEKAVADYVEEAASALGGLFVLINNA